MKHSIEALAFTTAGLSTSSGLPLQTITHAIRNGELKAVKSGRRYIVLREDAVAWLRKGRDNGEIVAPVSHADHVRLAALNAARKPAD